MNFADRLLTAISYRRFKSWDRPRQLQYLRDHPNSKMNPNYAIEHQEKDDGGNLPSAPKPESNEGDGQIGHGSQMHQMGHPAPLAPTTFMVLNKAFGPLGQAAIKKLNECLTQTDKLAINNAEFNLRSLGQPQLKFLVYTLEQTGAAPKELDPNTQQFINTLVQVLRQG
jgi:hypothetical protein